MLLTCLFTVLTMEPTFQITLDLGGVPGEDVSLNRVILAADGSLLGLSPYRVWHWDSEGRLIRCFGHKGEGPGEFLYVSEALWDGEHYWVIDGSRQASSIFDAEGNYLFQQGLYFRQLLRVGSQLFSLDHSQLRFDPVTYPPVLQPIQYTIQDRKLNVSKTGPPFKKVSVKQMEYSFNFKLLWVARDGDRYLVVDQLEPKMRIYSPETIERENSVPLDQTFSPDFIPIQVTRWVNAPKELPRQPQNYTAMKKWMHSFSKINYFGPLGIEKEYVVAYLIPDPEDNLSSRQIIQTVDGNGKILGPLFEGAGMIVGSRDRQVLVYNETDTVDDIKHVLEIYQF